MHTKVLIRSQNYSEHYQQWLQKGVGELLELFSGSYANGVFGKGADDLDYEILPTFRRITWYPDHVIHQEMSFIMDYFMLRLIQCNYMLVLSDERNEVFDSGVRITIHRHYMKPAEDATSDFGNIILEHRFNPHTNNLALTVNNLPIYGSGSFEKLMELLLS